MAAADIQELPLKASVSEAPDDDVNAVRLKRGARGPWRDCQTAALVPWQRAASSQPVRSSAEQSSLSVCGLLPLMCRYGVVFLALRS